VLALPLFLYASWSISETRARPGGHRISRSQVIVAGHSLHGRTIKAVAQGAASAPVRILVVGSIHGDETAGQAVVRRLRSVAAPAGIQLWTVRTVNPDGVVSRTRANARGVDLNRNFPYHWRRQGSPFSPSYSGQRPLSEPETRAVRRLTRRIRPQVTIWYHQALELVDTGSGADPRFVQAYARRSGLPARRIGFLPGVATRWQNNRFPGTSAFVVELPAGRLSKTKTEDHIGAVHAVARLAPTIFRPRVGAVQLSHISDRVVQPPIDRRHIPFGARRKQEMRRYARRHYGIDDYHLRHPRVVVLHLSVTESAQSVIETFARDQPDPELGELPGVCAHYVIDQRGRIFELVSRRLMCRHTVGLNYVAFGIEHVGMREGEVMNRRRQLQASLALVRWLQDRYGIRTRDVIGHNESLQSPYHRERVAHLRNQTHADFPSSVARRYRRLLAAA
jgi:N-acetylmuramoyl-L-alanine amidase